MELPCAVASCTILGRVDSRLFAELHSTKPVTASLGLRAALHLPVKRMTGAFDSIEEAR